MLEVRDVSVRFGGVVALDGLSFDVGAGEICGLIGPNGAGKTTMFNVVSGVYPASTGSVHFEGRDLLSLPPHRIAGAGISRTFQDLALFPTMTVLDNVMVGAHTRSSGNWVTAALGWRTGRTDRRVRDEAMDLLSELGLAHRAFQQAAGLPYGTLKRIEIARAMASAPRLLLLDEPASGLNHEEVLELGSLVADLRSRHRLTVLLVEHHMRLVMGVSDQVVVLNFGERIAAGTPEQVQNDPAVIAAYLGGEVAA